MSTPAWPLEGKRVVIAVITASSTLTADELQEGVVDSPSAALYRVAGASMPGTRRVPVRSRPATRAGHARGRSCFSPVGAGPNQRQRTGRTTPG